MPYGHVEDTELYYEEIGTGPPVLLVHGTACCIASWGGAFADLGCDHRVIAYDRRGYGQSAGRPARDYGQHAEDAIALLEQTAASPATVVGWSSGGVVALDVAIRRPDLVASLVIVETPLHGQTHPSVRLLTAYPGVLLLALRGRDAAAAERFVRLVSRETDGRNSWDRFPEDMRVAMLAHSATTVSEFRPSRRPGTGEHLRRRALAAIACPSRYLVGELSESWFQRSARRFARLVPDATVHVVPGGSHSLPIERTTEFVRHVREAVRETSGEPVPA